MINALDLSQLTQESNRIKLALEGVRVQFLRLNDEEINKDDETALVKRAVEALAKLHVKYECRVIKAVSKLSDATRFVFNCGGNKCK